MIVAWLTSKLAGPIATAAAVVLALLLTVQTVKLAEARKSMDGLASALARAATDLSTCRSNRAGLEASLTAQNAAVEAARQAGEQMRARSAKAVSEAQNATAAAERRAAAIMARKPVGADACQRALEADDLILGAIR